MSGGGTRRLFVAGAEAHGEEERGRQGDEGRGFRAHGAIVAGVGGGVDGEEGRVSVGPGETGHGWAGPVSDLRASSKADDAHLLRCVDARLLVQA